MGQSASHAFHQRVWYVALVVHVITAWFSSGYYAADEHFQIIAFAQARLGELNIADLPWEFEARMRSGFLPGIAYVVIVASRTLLTAEPLHIAFILRLITALFALVVVRTFVRAALTQVSDQLQRPFILLSYFLWFLPYQHVRFSSETCAGLFFLVGLSQLMSATARDRSWLLAGFFFGLCVQMKPAMIVACGGAMGWFLFISVARGRVFFRLLGGGLIAMALGMAVDSWFYGEPMHTLWNYLYKNSLSISKVRPLPVASETYPWWYYFPWMMKYGIWPIGAVLVTALLWLTWRVPKSWLVWCVWPYLVLISLIPHKELRFVFPLVDLAPFALVIAWQSVPSAWSTDERGRRRALILALALLVLVNTAGLVTAGLTSASSGRARLAEQMIAIRPSDPMTLGYTQNEPGIWDIRVPGFYLWGDFVDVGTFDPCSSPSVLSDHEAPDLLIAPVDKDQGSGCELESGGYRPLARSEPGWATFILDLYNSERHGPYLLYQLEHEP
jgi:phosphatidylinositol glycan class B